MHSVQMYWDWYYNAGMLLITHLISPYIIFLPPSTFLLLLLDKIIEIFQPAIAFTTNKLSCPSFMKPNLDLMEKYVHTVTVLNGCVWNVHFSLVLSFFLFFFYRLSGDQVTSPPYKWQHTISWLSHKSSLYLLIWCVRVWVHCSLTWNMTVFQTNLWKLSKTLSFSSPFLSRLLSALRCSLGIHDVWDKPPKP